MPLTLLSQRRLRRALAVIALLSVGGGLAVSMQAATASRESPPRQAAEQPREPNVVFILTDDLSFDLLPFMPQVRALQRGGLTFEDYFVSDSLCCPSRSSILTGNFPHDTGVFGNVGSHGGFHVFYSRGEEQQTFAVALQGAGYRTAMMGKYLNGYMSGPTPGSPVVAPATYVPPGWSEWDVAGNGYGEFDYNLNQNGVLQHYGHQPSDYLTDVLAARGVDFINRSAVADKPFFLELATFAPHQPYTPAPRDASDFPGLTAPRPPNFDVLPTDPPRWLADHKPLAANQMDQIDHVFRRRVQSVQAVDDLIAQIRHALAADGVARNTYIVFSSDNGLHTGEYRLMPGKMTAFDTDVRVPLVVTGPGVRAGTSTDAMAENIDLAKTFSGIGGANLPSDGHSLLGLLHGQAPADWRNAALIEHHGPDLNGTDPDFQQTAGGSPRTYSAMRTHDFLYVEYNDGEREFYDLRNDPFELRNLAGGLTDAELAHVHTELLALENCHDGASCWAAMHVAPGP